MYFVQPWLIRWQLFQQQIRPNKLTARTQKGEMR